MKVVWFLPSVGLLSIGALAQAQSSSPIYEDNGFQVYRDAQQPLSGKVGQVIRLRVKPKKKGGKEQAASWASLTPENGKVLDAKSGEVQLLRPRVALFKGTVDKVTLVVPIIVRPAGEVSTSNLPCAVAVNHSELGAASLAGTAGPVDLTYTSLEPDKIKVSSDNKNFGPTATQSNGKPVYFEAHAEGVAHIAVEGGGKTSLAKINCVDPEIELVADSSTWVQNQPVTFHIYLTSPSFDRLSAQTYKNIYSLYSPQIDWDSSTFRATPTGDYAYDVVPLKPGKATISVHFAGSKKLTTLSVDAQATPSTVQIDGNPGSMIVDDKLTLNLILADQNQIAISSGINAGVVGRVTIRNVTPGLIRTLAKALPSVNHRSQAATISLGEMLRDLPTVDAAANPLGSVSELVQIFGLTNQPLRAIYAHGGSGPDASDPTLPRLSATVADDPKAGWQLQLHALHLGPVALYVTLTNPSTGSAVQSDVILVNVIPQLLVKVRDVDNQTSKDYFGSEVTREFYVKELYFENELAGASSDDLKNKGITVEGKSITLRSIIAEPATAPGTVSSEIMRSLPPDPFDPTLAPVAAAEYKSLLQFSGMLQVSSEEEKDLFVLGRLQAIVYDYPPLELDVITGTKDAIAAREPGAVFGRLLQYFALATDFLNVSYSKAWSNPFRGAGDADRRGKFQTLGKSLLDIYNGLIKNEGKGVADGVVMGETLVVSATKTEKRYIFIPKSSVPDHRLGAVYKIFSVVPGEAANVTYSINQSQQQTNPAPNKGGSGH